MEPRQGLGQIREGRPVADRIAEGGHLRVVGLDAVPGGDLAQAARQDVAVGQVRPGLGRGLGTGERLEQLDIRRARHRAASAPGGARRGSRYPSRSGCRSSRTSGRRSVGSRARSTVGLLLSPPSCRGRDRRGPRNRDAGDGVSTGTDPSIGARQGTTASGTPSDAKFLGCPEESDPGQGPKLAARRRRVGTTRRRRFAFMGRRRHAAARARPGGPRRGPAGPGRPPARSARRDLGRRLHAASIGIHDRPEVRLHHRRRRFCGLRAGQPPVGRSGDPRAASSRPAGPTIGSTSSSTCRPR